jgi:anti-sigma regulatory factor (Ser/Thr protein kinase)
MTSLGRNPGRIIPAVRAFVDAQVNTRVRFIGEPIWSGRHPAEIAEATRHEALLNLAFRDSPVTIVCPYQQDGLDPTVLSDVCRTHPIVVEAGQRRASSDYADPLSIYEATDWPLPDSPPEAEEFRFGPGTLPQVRSFVTGYLHRSGLTSERAADVLLAVNEVATNSLLYGGGFGTLRLWREPDRDAVVCEIADRGRIKDPLVGRSSPGPGSERGRGLWLVHQFCDLAEVRSDPEGTVIRMHARVHAPGQ